jgi:hypothetical protein
MLRLNENLGSTTIDTRSPSCLSNERSQGHWVNDGRRWQLAWDSGINPSLCARESRRPDATAHHIRRCREMMATPSSSTRGSWQSLGYWHGGHVWDKRTRDAIEFLASRRAKLRIMLMDIRRWVRGHSWLVSSCPRVLAFSTDGRPGCPWLCVWCELKAS